MFHHHLCSWFFFYCYGDHRDLHVLPHSFPTHALPISGSRVSAGAPLFTIVDASVVWLTVHVPAEQASRIARGSQATFQVEGSSTIGRTSRTVSVGRSEEHTSELQSLMRISYAVFCLIKKTKS